MTEPSATRGAVMMIVGAPMVAVAVVTVVFTSEPLPVAVAVIGVVFLGVGSRQRRIATRR